MTAVVQVAAAGSPNAVFPAPVTPGNIILFCVSQRDGTGGVNGPGGFSLLDTYVDTVSSGNARRISMWRYTVQADTTLLTTGADSRTFGSSGLSDRVTALELAADYTAITAKGLFANTVGNLDCGGAVTPDSGSSVVVVGIQLYDDTSGLLTPAAGVTEFVDFSTTPCLWGGYKEVPSASGSYTIRGVSVASGGTYLGLTAVFVAGAVAAPPDPEPIETPPPAGVLLEIYTHEVGGARWDDALWDEAVWASSGWQDVTPQGVQVDISWGSNRPELGILSVPVAASWAVDFFDPGRVLDPSNADGPYYGDLVPFLPIRVSHRGTIVRVGYATGIGHSFATSGRDGYIRATDNISRLANAQVPPDTELSDTLYARAADAIAAAGLTVEVAAPIGTDPPVAPWVTGAHEWSAWQWITDAAQDALWIPIVDRMGVLTFRPWSTPMVRGRGITSAELVDLQVITDYSGLFSVIQARQDEDVVIERRITPPPAYGARAFARDDITLDPAGWAEAVLADRALATLRWVPGAVRPLTAVRVEQLATIEAVEQISLAVTEEDPPITIAGIVVGGDIRIRGRADDEAVWQFVYQTAQGVLEPLIETGGAPADYLLMTGGGDYLYPTTGG